MLLLNKLDQMENKYKTQLDRFVTMYLQLHLENDFITLNIISIFWLVCEVGGDQVHKVGDQVHEGFT